MKIKKLHTIFFIILPLFIASCATTKYIPENQYLLEQIFIEMDDRGVDKAALLPFIQQKPNDSKVGLGIYNWVDNDSSFFKKLIRKIGEPPVIFNDNLVTLSVNELGMEMKNRGYFNSSVFAEVDTVGKKARVLYQIHNGEPYHIRHFEMDVPQMTAMAEQRNRGNNQNRRQTNQSNQRRRFYNANRERNLIKEGAIFDMNTLETQRTQVSSLLRNQGYYTFTKENLHYLADTTLRSNQVDLTLTLLDSIQALPYTVQRVNVYSGYDIFDRDAYKIVDSIEYRGINIYYDSLHFLRPRVISDKIMVRPQSLFRERSGESTFSLFQALNCVGRVDVRYEENNYPDSTWLDCNIYLTPGNSHSLQTGIEGTNKAGDLGVAVDVTYGNLNVFNGSEIFNIHWRGAYEFVNQSSNEALTQNYYELGVSPSLTFPKLHLPFIWHYIADRFNSQTQYSLGYNIQRRPEYMRNFFNFNWKVRWSGQRNPLSHSLSLLDINYVNMPWKSDFFRDYLNNNVDPLTKYSYDNIFTAGINYGLVYTNKTRGRVRQNFHTIRLNAESSGAVLNLISSSTHAKKTNDQYTIFGNPFAQYVKGDIDFSETVPMSPIANLAYHVGIGVAYPYGNSGILPFEKRYYAGGPNSVRGWSTRYLGPGSFNQGKAGDPVTHVGDINFIMSAEYRFKILSWFEPAFFVDAGNIWTIKDYPNQPDGLFRWNKFYKEMAVGTGIGLRLDLSILIFRLDFGTRVYDPARPEDNRFALFKGRFLKNSAAYVAIGYPF